MEAVTTEQLLRRRRRSSKFRAFAMAAGAVVILLFSVLIAVSAQAEESGPTVVPVYGGDGGKTPSAYVITDKDGTMFFCSITAGASVYVCQQLHKGGK